MKLLKFGFIGLAVAFAIAACSHAGTPPANNNPAANAAPTPDEWAGVRRLFNETCSNCHKADGRGGEVTFSEGDDKPLKVPSLREGKKAEENDADYIEQIKFGEPGEMPAFGKRLNDDQIKQLVAYIRKEFQGKAVKLPPASASPAAPPAETKSPTPKDDKGDPPKADDGKS
jgi:mono/diheme cytochrome c family protein